MENHSEEDPINGDDGEGDYLENKGEGAQLISMTASGSVGETKQRIYSRSEMEALRFLDVDAQRRMWNAVYAGLEVIVALEYKRLRFPNDQKKGKQEKLLWDKFGGKNEDLGAVGMNILCSNHFF